MGPDACVLVFGPARGGSCWRGYCCTFAPTVATPAHGAATSWPWELSFVRWTLDPCKALDLGLVMSVDLHLIFETHVGRVLLANWLKVNVLPHHTATPGLCLIGGVFDCVLLVGWHLLRRAHKVLVFLTPGGDGASNPVVGDTIGVELWVQRLVHLLVGGRSISYFPLAAPGVVLLWPFEFVPRHQVQHIKQAASKVSLLCRAMRRQGWCNTSERSGACPKRRHARSVGRICRNILVP